MPASFKAWRTVSDLTSTPIESFRSRASPMAVTILPDVIFQTRLRLLAMVSFAGRPPLSLCAFVWDFACSLNTVVWLTPSCIAICLDERPLLRRQMILFCVSLEVFFMVKQKDDFRIFLQI